MGLSKRTDLLVANHTPNGMRIKIRQTDGHDWDHEDKYRPDVNFQGAYIPANSSKKERGEINRMAGSCWFTMDIKFDNGDEIRLRIDQKDALNKKQRKHEITGKNADKYIAFQYCKTDVNRFYIKPAIPNSSCWLKDIDGNKLLSEIEMPGTHNSGARVDHKLLKDTAKCQKMKIPEQLETGIRFLDLRCRHHKDKFPIYHGIVDQNIDFGEILTVCKQFLSSNPSEFIIMSIKEEHTSSGNSRTYEETFKSYINNDPVFFLENRIPKVSEVRGKIIIVSRYASSTIGIKATPWEDNKVFSIKNFEIQDKYQTSDKWNAVESFLKDTRRTTGKNYFSLNFTSGTPNPEKLSKEINRNLYGYCISEKSMHTGVLLMDFPEEHLIHSIISLNFNKG